METLESLKRKISTSQELLSVVKTMKSLAAVNIRQFQGALPSLDEYNAIVTLCWQAFFRTQEMTGPDQQSKQGNQPQDR